MKEQVTIARDVLSRQVSQLETARKPAIEEQARLQASMTKILKHFNLLAAAVYGRPFSPEEIRSVYAGKYLIFRPLCDT